jgi:predicted acylesterase/phospholipase RssA
MVRKYIPIISILVTLTLLNSISALKDKTKCYVLALEGGGDKGAYQAGAIKGLVDNVPNGETQWDVVTGISVGSMDAAALAIFDIGNESNAADFLVQTWRDIKGKRDIYQNWMLGPLEGMFFKTGLYDTSPLRKKIQSVVKDNDLKRKFVCGATNFETGSFDTWDEETLYREEYEDAIVSSGAFPVIFPINQFRGNYYMDGGVKISVDLASGINKCLDMGYDETNIVVDVVLLNSKVLTVQDAKGVHPLGVLVRIMEIYGYDNAMKDFEDIKVDFPKVNYRYVVAPTKSLPSGSIPLTFSPQEIETMIGFGLEDAKTVVKKGEGVNLAELLHGYKQERKKLLGRRSKKVEKNNTEELPPLFLE